MSDETGTPDDNLITFPGASRPAEVPAKPAPEAASEVQELDTPRRPRPEFTTAAVEAVLFVADRPLELAEICQLMGELGEEVVLGALSTLRDGYLRRGAGIRLHEVAGGYQLRTAAQASPWVAAVHGARPFRLSKAAVETLSIVAYRQPVTRAEVDEIRGVDSGGILRSLLERKLLRVMGRKDDPGRPLLYGTSPEFLEVFGLRDLSDLPTLRDLRELRQDDPREGPVQLDFPDF
ncbi:MAG: SMC-Scp complex subunit ScpB [Proteobacteria bacterium]|nr:SMC-Scp complex subunit ScpB [Pseudomonadota bacterium]MCP4919310.1 SMC-Scp complex subunit ScpB [Pseudomonadota bacterium]